jgi:hypothetical protein
MFLIILSVLDVFSGLILLTYGSFTILHGFVGYMAAYSFFKGVLSFLSSIGMGYYFDWMGIIDAITGVMLLFLMWEFSFGFISTVGIIATLKGVYSLLRGVFKI